MNRHHRICTAILLLGLTAPVSAGITATEVSALGFTDSVGQDQRDMVEHKRMRVIGLRRFVLCVDGLKLLQTVGPAAAGAWGSAGYNLNPAISTVQLYEERDGRVVPARCQ